MPPPSILRARCTRRITSREPHTSEPTGAPSPLERQNVTVSKGSAQTAAGVPVATTAFHRRAPSRCSASPCCFAACATSLSWSSGNTRPPARLCVFSTETIRVGAKWTSSGVIAARTSAPSKQPPRPSVCTCTPESAEAAPAS